MTHSQVWIKVNAPCDEGIAPLVSALNLIQGVLTVDSCQEGSWGAYIFFTYGRNWRELACLLQEMSTLLSSLQLPCGYSFRLEWLGSNSSPRAQLSMEAEHVGYVTDGIQRIVATLNARMIVLIGDR